MKVRGTQETVSSIEVAKTTVYVRKNIRSINTPEFTGWEYDEVQYNKDDFIGLMEVQNQVNADRADFLEELIVEMAMVVYP